MRQLGVLVGSVVLALLAGCGPVDEQHPVEGAEAVELAKATAEAVLGLAVACQQDNYNQCVAAGYGSCSSWSVSTECGDSFCEVDYGLSPCFIRNCSEGPCQNIPLGATFQPTQKYRVCSNPQGQTCTEWSVIQYGNRVKCGCG